jgi:hypothetical protein
VPGENLELAREGYAIFNRGEVEDGRVLALLTLRAKGRESGVQVDTEYAHILTFRDGLCVQVDGFPSWREARAAAGVADRPD